MSRIARNIRFLRDKKNMTQQQFADMLGVKKSLIGAYEEARAEPKLAFLNKLSKIFSITLDDVVNRNLFTQSSETFVGTSLEVYSQIGSKFAKTKQRCFLPVLLPEAAILLHLENENKYFAKGTYLVAKLVGSLSELNQHDVLLDVQTGFVEKVSHINFTNSEYYKLYYAIEEVKGKERDISLEALTATIMDLQTQISAIKK